MCLIRYDTMEIYLRVKTLRGFPGSSAGKESACNAGDPGSIPRSERSPGEGKILTPMFLGFSTAQMVKNLPEIQETWVQSLVGKIP